MKVSGQRLSRAGGAFRQAGPRAASDDMERVARQQQQQQRACAEVVAGWRKAGAHQPASLDALASQLHAVFAEDRVNVEHVQALMEAYQSDPAHWRHFAKFDRYRYTRNLVDEGNGKFNLMILCWGEGHGSAIHDHADAHCFMKVLQGTLSEVRFAWPEQTTDEDEISEEAAMKEISRTQLKVNEVCYINDSLGLHRVENPSHTEPAVSLHLYCPPFDSCSVFNQRTGKKTTCKVSFWSKYGNKIRKEDREHFVEDN